MRELLLLVGCAALCACSDERPAEAPAPVVAASAHSAPAEVDTDPPMAAAGTVVEHPNGLRVEVETSGTGRMARSGRTVVFHQRVRVVPGAPPVSSSDATATPTAPVESPNDSGANASSSAAAAMTTHDAAALAAPAADARSSDASTASAHADATQKHGATEEAAPKTDAPLMDATLTSAPTANTAHDEHARAAHEAGSAETGVSSSSSDVASEPRTSDDRSTVAVHANDAAHANDASLAAATTTTTAVAATSGAAAEPSANAAASEPVWLSSTWTSGVPWCEVLGKGKLIAGLEAALDGARAGCRLNVRVPPALAYGAAGNGAIPPDGTLEIEIELVEVR